MKTAGLQLHQQQRSIQCVLITLSINDVKPKEPLEHVAGHQGKASQVSVRKKICGRKNKEHENICEPETLHDTVYRLYSFFSPSVTHSIKTIFFFLLPNIMESLPRNYK